MRRIRTILTVEEETKIIAKTRARKDRRSAAKKGKEGPLAADAEAQDVPTNLTDALVEAAEEAVAKVEDFVETATATIKATIEPATATLHDENPSRPPVAKPRSRQKKPLVVPQVVR
jgi:hypothetical protein